MNGINNNVSNSNYGSFGNNTSNSPKEEKSFFDNVIDSVKEFFEDGTENTQFASDDMRSNSYNTSNLDKAFLNSRSNTKQTYTLAPMKNQETMAQKWAKDNESAELKQKEREIAKLQQKVDTLQSRNKVLSRQNEQIIDHIRAEQANQTAPQDGQEVSSTQATQMNTTVDEKGVPTDEAKVYNSVPTHTSIPKEVLEQQQSDINELAAVSKVEAPVNTIKEDDTKAQENNVEAKV